MFSRIHSRILPVSTFFACCRIFVALSFFYWSILARFCIATTSSCLRLAWISALFFSRLTVSSSFCCLAILRLRSALSLAYCFWIRVLFSVSSLIFFIMVTFCVFILPISCSICCVLSFCWFKAFVSFVYSCCFFSSSLSLTLSSASFFLNCSSTRLF